MSGQRRVFTQPGSFATGLASGKSGYGGLFVRVLRTNLVPAVARPFPRREGINPEKMAGRSRPIVKTRAIMWGNNRYRYLTRSNPVIPGWRPTTLLATAGAGVFRARKSTASHDTPEKRTGKDNNCPT